MLKYDIFRRRVVIVKGLVTCLISILLFFAFQADRSMADVPLGTVKIAVPTANIRSEPIRTAAMIAQVNRGESFQVLSEKYGWYEIQLPNGKTGWIAGYIVIKQSTSGKSSKGGITIAVNKANIRSEPSRTAPVISQVRRNEHFDIVQEKFGWYKVRLPDGTLGWIAGYLTTGTANKQTQPHKQTGTVDADHVNVRNSPSLSSPVIGKIHTGETVEVIGGKEAWVQVLYNGQKAWISRQYVRFREKNNESGFTFAVIKKDGTNIRSRPITSSEVVAKASEGERYPIIGRKGDWYEIRTASWKEAYVASWIVSAQGKNDSQIPEREANNVTKAASDSVNRSGGLAGKTIILDPGHGGFDPGTSSVGGLPEKQLTLETMLILEQKLRQAGANVRLTRSNDHYVPLQKRIYEARQNETDAFISVHYDSSTDSGAKGFTTYYNRGHQKQLANHISMQLRTALPLYDRGVRYGDYFVIRENSRPAVLLELGYLSNPQESVFVATPSYQELVTNSVVKGLQSYFNQ